MTIYFCEGNYFILIILFQHTHQIPLHILVDFAVAGEGAAAFFVAAEGSDQVRVFDLFVEVADEATAGQVGRCNFVERADFLLAGGWVRDYDRTGKAGGEMKGRSSSNLRSFVNTTMQVYMHVSRTKINMIVVTIDSRITSNDCILVHICFSFNLSN